MAKPTRGRLVTLLAFALASAAVMAGLWLGPTPPERDAFALPDDATWQANERAAELLPEPDTRLFLFVGGERLDVRGNVLRLDVMRALVARGEEVKADPVIGPLFETRMSPGGQEVEGPLGFPEVVREIMNGESLHVFWEGPSFEAAKPRDFHRLLDEIFAIEGSEEGVHPYKIPFAPDLTRTDEGLWHSTGLLHPVGVSRVRVEEAIASGKLAGVEDFELRVDAIYAEPIGGGVQVWSYAGFDAQIDAQIAENTPLVLLSLVMMVLLVGVFLRDWRDAAVVAVSLVLLFAWIGGIQGWLGSPSTQLTGMLPILIVALAVDFYLHTSKRWRRLGSASESIASLRRPLGLATVTTAVAFGTAMASPVPMLAEWGLLAVLSVPCAYLLLGVFAPTLRAALGAPPERSKGAGKGLSDIAARPIEGGRAAIVSVALLVLVAGLAVGRPSAGFDAGDYLDPASRLMRTLRMDQRTFPNLGAPGVILIEGQDLASPATFEAVGGLVARLPELGAVASDKGAGTTIIDIAEGREPGAALGEHLVKVAKEGLGDPFNPLQAHTSLSASEVEGIYKVTQGRVTATKIPFGIPDADDWDALGALRERIEADLEGIRATGDTATVTGLNYVQFAFINRLTESFDRSTLLASVACALVLIIVFRRWRPVLTVLLPVAAAAVSLQAIMSLADIRLNVISVQVLSLALGLGLDYSIHMTQALTDARREAPDKNREAWIATALSETGAALGGSALTTVVGFGLLAASPMSLFRGFGGLMMLAIGLSALFALVLAPALFSLLSAPHPFDGVVEDPVEPKTR